MQSTDSIVAVTGAGGFVGHSVCRRLLAHKFAVRGLVRYRSDLTGEFQFDMTNQVIDPAALSVPIRAVVHCAWDTKSRDLQESRRINVEGTQWLVDCCKKAGVKQLVFVSSLAAHADAESIYARTKFEAENYLLSLPDAASFITVISSGIVVGKGGVFAGARTAVKRHAMIPVFHKASQGLLPTVFIDDLCNAIVSSINHRVTGRLCVGNGKGISLPDFYKGLGLLDREEPTLITFPGAKLLPQGMLDKLAKPPASTDHMLEPARFSQIDFSSATRLPGCETFADFWTSLEKLVEPEGAENVIANIRAFQQKSGG